MVDFKKILKERNMSVRECSMFYDIPYATLYAIVNKTANLNDCKFSTVKRLAKFAGIPMEYLDMEDENFNVFRSNLHHQLKREGDILFVQQIRSLRLIDAYMKNEQYAKALYLVSLVEYISNMHNIEISEDVKKYANIAMEQPLYLSNSVTSANIEYIEEFRRHNIMECDIYDAV